MLIKFKLKISENKILRNTTALKRKELEERQKERAEQEKQRKKKELTKGDTRKNKGGKKWTKEAHALKKKFKIKISFFRKIDSRDALGSVSTVSFN